MTVVLDSKDLQAIDEEMKADSKVWGLFGTGHPLLPSDFVGVNEVRVNTMTGFTASDYKRGADNARKNIEVGKETKKLTHERWLGYDLDTLDESENLAYTIANIVRQHNTQVAIPEKDVVAVQALASNAGKKVEETPDTTNSLQLFDQAQQYMVDSEVIGQPIMLVSSDYYQSLKNNDKVSKTFTVNAVTQLRGIDRRVAMLDDTPIVVVPKARFKTADGKAINYILTTTNIGLPVEKFNTIDIIPANTDRDGYRDTVKGLDYYDFIVLDNAKVGIYLSTAKATPAG